MKTRSSGENQLDRGVAHPLTRTGRRNIVQIELYSLSRQNSSINDTGERSDAPSTKIIVPAAVLSATVLAVFTRLRSTDRPVFRSSNSVHTRGSRSRDCVALVQDEEVGAIGSPYRAENSVAIS